MTGREPPPWQAGGQRWVVLGTWFLASVSGFMVLSTLGILLPAVSEELGLSPTQQGLLGSAAYWGNLVLAIPLSWWMSRYGPKALTTATLLLGTLLIFVQTWAPTFWVLLAARLAFGVSIIAREPARALLIRQWFRPEEAVLANSVSNVLFGVVVGGGLLATPFILDSLGDDWRLTLQIFGGLFALITVSWVVLGRERATPEFSERSLPREAGLIKSAISHRDLWVAGFGFIGAVMAWSAFLSFYPTLMLDRYEISLRWIGAILAVGIFVGGVTGLAVGYLVMTRDLRKGLLQVFGVLMVLTYVGMTATGSMPLLMAASFANGVAWGFFPILYTVPFQLRGIRPREIAVAIAFLTVMTSLGFLLGPLATGFLQEATDLRTALQIVSLSAVSLTVTGIVLRPVSTSEVIRDSDRLAAQGEH